MYSINDQLMIIEKLLGSNEIYALSYFVIVKNYISYKKRDPKIMNYAKLWKDVQ